jgi:hypothetical protein
VFVTFGAYLLGGVIGLGVDKGGPRLRHDWPIYLRVQLLATSAMLGLFSAWRLTAPHQIVAPVVMAGLGFALLGAAWVTRGPSTGGQAALESWAASPNGVFWVLPIAGALVGPSASVTAALYNAASAAPNAVNIHLMRRDAPTVQRRATNWVDQSPLLAVGLGLLLHLEGPAPAASHWVLVVAGPLLAFVGSALFIGSVLHPHNLAAGRSPAGIWRWAYLSVVRLGYLVPVAVITRSRGVAVIAVLSALGAPAFSPAQQAVLYGYRSGVVNAAVRWGWLLLPIGLAVAYAIR